MENQNIKQTIVMRADLSMRKGKMIAQGAHASIAFLATHYRNGTFPLAVERAWIEGLFTKVCVRVDSEVELQSIIDKARAAGLTVHPIVDAGLTEFHGIPTLTCCAIGPDYSDLINSITGNLKLL